MGFRRRLMMAQRQADDWIQFQDDWAMKCLAYSFGTTELKTGLIDSVELEGNDDTEVHERFFARTFAYSAHKSPKNAKNGGADDIPAVSAHSETFKIELEATEVGGYPWDISGLTDTSADIIKVSTSITNEDKITVTADDWASQTAFEKINGKWVAEFTTSSSGIAWINVYIRATAGTKVRCNLISVSGTRVPIGITYDQAKYPTSLNNNVFYWSIVEYLNELQYFTALKTIARDAFRGCASLKEVDCRNVTGRASGDPITWQDCSSLYKLVLRDWSTTLGYNGSINNNRSQFRNCSNLKRLVLPKATRFYSASYANYPIFTMLDFGTSFAGFNTSSNYGYSNTGINSNTTVIIRNTTPATDNGKVIVGIRKLYVPASALQDWKDNASYASIVNYIYAIGGEEWVSQYGSADEYANLTQEEREINYPNA